MVCGHNVADLVVILKTLPTHEAIRALGAKILEEVQKQQAQLSKILHVYYSVDKIKLKTSVSIVTEPELEITDRGFNILSLTPPENTKATVRVLITTIGRNFRLISSSMHLDMKYLQSHLAAVRHRYGLIFHWQIFPWLFRLFILVIHV